MYIIELTYEKNLDEVKRNLDEIEITDNDNAFSDAWS